MRDLVFYTCFLGSDYNWANLIPTCPSTTYPCYYFTNNMNNFNRAKSANWTPIFVDIEIKHDMIESSFQSKIFKSCPHTLDILDKHKYSCYFDSKHNVNVEKIEELVDILENSDYSIILPKHPSKFTCIWEEFDLAMQFDKYRAEKDKSMAYIENQLTTLSDKVKYHLTTQFIIRKHTDKTRELNELWYKHIQECGIMCQLSFFFIQQLYSEVVFPIEYQHCYCYCYPV